MRGPLVPAAVRHLNSLEGCGKIDVKGDDNS